MEAEPAHAQPCYQMAFQELIYFCLNERQRETVRETERERWREGEREGERENIIAIRIQSSNIS